MGIGARSGTDHAQPDEAHREHAQQSAREQPTVAVGLDPCAVQPRHQEQDGDGREHHDHAAQLVGHHPQHRVVRGVVPDRLDVLGRDQAVGLGEVVVFQEQTAESGREEDDEGRQHQQEPGAHAILERVIRVERNAVGGRGRRPAIALWPLLDLHAVGVVRPHFMQRTQVQHHQQQQHQRQRDHMQCEEAVEGGVAGQVVAHDPFGESVADHRDRPEQRDDHLRAPERHLSPWQHVAHEGFGHQHQVDQHAQDPDQLARLLVTAVHQAAEHVQVDHDEEQRGPGGMHVADQPAPLHVAHDVLDRREGLGCAGLVVHGQEDAGHDLVDQDQQCQRTEVVPEVEVLRRVVLGDVLAVHRHQPRRAGIDPVGDTGGGTGKDVGHAYAAPCGSTPMMMVLSSW